VSQLLPSQAQEVSAQPFSREELVKTGNGFFGDVSSGLAKLIEQSVSKYGLPNGYILGEEASGAIVAGVRYGKGTLHTQGSGDRPIFWQGPSLGFDMGVDGAKTMMLVYNLPRMRAMFRRYAGVNGSAYIIGGFGMTVLKRNNIVVVPVRAGIGARLGLNIGYLRFTRKQKLLPF
jgi:hypothetical protein